MCLGSPVTVPIETAPPASHASLSLAPLIVDPIAACDFSQLLRNLPPEDWVTEVAKAYPDDDEVKSMMGQVGKLMRMIDYYQTKKPRK